MFRKLALALVAPLLLFACASESDDEAVETDDPAEVTDDGGAEATDGGSAGALAALQAAPDAAAAAGSGRFEMTFAVDATEGSFEMLATGGFSGDQMSMELDFGAMMRQLAEETGESIPPGLDEPMRMVADGTTFYIRMPMLDLLTGTSGWLSATPEDLGQSSEALGLGGTSTSPTAMMETLRGVADDVEEVGTEEVRGVDTTHYRATIDMARALDTVPEDQRAALESQLEQMRAAGLESLPVEVWVDDDGLVRRMVMVMDDLTTGMGQTGSMTMTMEFFDYGEPYSVEVPPASEVTPISEAMPGMAGALG